MSFKKTMIIAVAFSSAFAFQSLAHPPERSGHPMQRIFQQLDLSLSQKQDLRSLMTTTHRDLAIYREDMAALRAELDDLTDSDDFTASTVIEIFSRYQPVMREMARQRLTSIQQVESILTSEQQVKMLELHEKRADRPWDNHQQERAEKMLSKVSEKLGIDETQSDILDALTQVFATRHAIHEIRRTFLDTLKTLELSGSVTDAEFELRFTEFYSGIVAASLQHVTAKRTLFPLLTEEQRRILQEMRDKRPPKGD